MDPNLVSGMKFGITKINPGSAVCALLRVMSNMSKTTIDQASLERACRVLDNLIAKVTYGGICIPDTIEEWEEYEEVAAHIDNEISEILSKELPGLKVSEEYARKFRGASVPHLDEEFLARKKFLERWKTTLVENADTYFPHKAIRQFLSSGIDLSVLYVSANPIETDNVRLDEELRDLTTERQSSKYREQIKFTSQTATRVRDFTKILAESNPVILHLSGHGANGNYVLLDDDESAREIPRKSLLTLLANEKEVCQLVIFNFCDSQKLAKAACKTVPFAIGITGTIDDVPSNLFSASFSREVFAGGSLKRAFNIALEVLRINAYDKEAKQYKLNVMDDRDPGSMHFLS